MGTRGAFGFRVGGADKVTYNHFDSYPDGMGERVVKSLVERARADGDWLGRLRSEAAALRAVDRDATPTREDVERCRPYTDLGVSRQKTSDWYCLLRGAQASELGAEGMLGAGVYIDGGAFLHDSLFCEWAYIVNLDSGKLETYRGFVTSEPRPDDVGENAKPPHAGRYVAAEPPASVMPDRTRQQGSYGYHYLGVTLVAEHDLASIDDWRATWAKEAERAAHPGAVDEEEAA